VSIKIPPILTDRHRQYPAKINENALCSRRQTFEVLCIITDRHTSDEEGFHFWQTYIEGTLQTDNPTDNYKTLFLTVIQKHTLRSHRQTIGMKMAFHLDKLSMKIPSVPTDRHG